jgi:hypothetical protein
MVKVKKVKDPAKVARGRRSRAKGAEWDRDVRDVLRGWWPDAKRGFQTRGAVADNVPDVTGTPFWVECKTGKNIGWNDAIIQASTETDGRPWLVFAKCERLAGRETPKVVIMSLDLLEVLLENKYGERKEASSAQEEADN